MDPTFSKLPRPKATLLLVGAVGAGKRTLSKALSKIPPVESVIGEIRTSEMLQGPEDRPRIDLFVLVASMLSKKSWQVVEHTLSSLPPHIHAMGRCCVVCTHVEYPSRHAVSSGDIATAENFYDVPVFYVNLEREQARITLAKQMCEMARVSVGKSGVSPLLLKAVSFNMVERSDLE